MSAEFLLPVDRARAFCVEVLAQVGVGREEAALCTESLLDASLRGVDSHGVALLPVYAERIRSGQIRPGRELQVVRRGGAAALCDGQHGLGPVLACRAADLAADMAREGGAGAVTLKDGNYVGALAFYAERLARRGLLALCAANSTPRVAPHNGREGLHGTNPLCYAVPVAGGEPLVFDAATGHSAAKVGKVRDEGGLLERGVALDREGRPTTDPGEALEGVLLPVGGALGYGLGLLVDLLCGGLADGPCGPDVPPVSQLQGPYGCGFFALALDPAFFGGREALAQRAAFLAGSARGTPPAAGGDSVRAPGDRARQERRQRLERGLPFSRARWRAVLERLEACGVGVGAWRAACEGGGQGVD